MPPIERRVAVNGITLALFEWGREFRGKADSILLAHATGFHARCWDRVVSRLGQRHVVAVDQRGHGRSDKPQEVHWQDFGRDLAELVVALELRDAVGVGHSMGGHAITDAAAAEPQAFRRLVLVDPVIASLEQYAGPGFVGLSGAMHPTAKRRNYWSSYEEMFERFKGRPPFDTWDRDVLLDYCRHGILPDPSGAGFVLACPPEFEANTYMASFGNGRVLDSARAVEVPVLIVRVMEPPPDRSLMDFRYSPTWPGLVSLFRRGREIHLPDRTHFVPMEDPAFVAQLILADES